MTILAFDISTKCGWAGVDDAGSVHHGTFIAPKERRFMEFYNFTRSKVLRFRPAIIAYEGQFFSGHGSDLLMQLSGIVRLVADQHEAAVFDGLKPNAIKKAFTGKGNASKEQIIARCHELGLRPCDDNAADAIALLTVCMNKQRIMKGGKK